MSTSENFPSSSCDNLIVACHSFTDITMSDASCFNLRRFDSFILFAPPSTHVWVPYYHAHLSLSPPVSSSRLNLLSTLLSHQGIRLAFLPLASTSTTPKKALLPKVFHEPVVLNYLAHVTTPQPNHWACLLLTYTVLPFTLNLSPFVS